MLPRDAVGVGLRAPHYEHVARNKPQLDYFELLSENYLSESPARDRARAIREHYPVVLHGVGLNLLGHEPLDEVYLDALARLADELDAHFVSDHLCWSRSQAMQHHDLLPTPFTDEIAAYAAKRAEYVQHRLGRPFALENLSSYVRFQQSSLTEWEFYTRVVERAGVGMMLDINNIHVSSYNHGFDPRGYLDAIDFERVVQVHLAGCAAPAGDVLVDTHDGPVSEEVWQLYAEAWRRGGPFPTLLEWDASIPPFERLLSELDKARQVKSSP